MNMKAKVYQASGYHYPVHPAGKSFSLREMQKIVGGSIQIQKLPKTGGVMVMNDEGAFGLPPNVEATKIWHENFPLDEFPHNNVEHVFGDVLVCDGRLVK